MTTAISSDILKNHYKSMQPQIYFDESPERGGKQKRTKRFSPSSTQMLRALDNLMGMLDCGRDWKIIRMRANGLSYTHIAANLQIGVATVNRLMRKIEDHNPVLGHLLANAETLKNSK